MHGISKSRVERLAKHLAHNVTSPPDMRGKHANRPHAVKEELVAQVDEHIRSFPRRKSHYSRTDNVTKYYLSSELSVKKMHTLYLQKHEPEAYLMLQSESPMKPKISYDFYYRYFVSNFNFSFGKPRSDTCQTCDTSDKNLLVAESDEDKRRIKTEKELHLRQAEAFYTALREKSTLAKENECIETICIDYQQNLELPKVPSSDVFYSRQLWEYSFCIHVASTHKSFFYMYNESVGRKGQNEVVSFLNHFINNALDGNVTDLYVFSDNCSAQNKNNTIMQYYFTLIDTGKLKFIQHSFPEPGHSFLPCDRSFGVVEIQKRKHERVYVPTDWHNIVKCSSNKFEVVNVTQEMILNFSEHFIKLFKKTVLNNHKEKLAITQYRLFRYSCENKVVVQCSKTLSGLVMSQFAIRRPNVSLSLPSKQLYRSMLPIKDAKFKDVMKLAHKYVPPSDMWFYNTLQSASLQDQIVSSSSDYE